MTSFEPPVKNIQLPVILNWHPHKRYIAWAGRPDQTAALGIITPQHPEVGVYIRQVCLPVTTPSY